MEDANGNLFFWLDKEKFMAAFGQPPARFIKHPDYDPMDDEPVKRPKDQWGRDCDET